ncbi:MAG TPA: hypothetical protein VK673_17705 [Chthoniobacterales bacterium]|nr:hypothetical protein [Chthoniobacterales bacterium]
MEQIYHKFWDGVTRVELTEEQVKLLFAALSTVQTPAAAAVRQLFAEIAETPPETPPWLNWRT